MELSWVATRRGSITPTQVELLGSWGGFFKFASIQICIIPVNVFGDFLGHEALEQRIPDKRDYRTQTTYADALKQERGKPKSANAEQRISDNRDYRTQQSSAEAMKQELGIQGKKAIHTSDGSSTTPLPQLVFTVLQEDM
ncbi:hypothetical protein Ancab_014253 [Ancistrocladus abbreviatus]